MKRAFIVVGFALATSGVTPTYAQSGIPTLDVNSVSQLNALLDQLETAQAQLQHAQAQLSALTESSGFGYVVQNPQVRDAMRQTLPAEVGALLNRLDGNDSALSNSIDAVITDVNASVDNFDQSRRDLKTRSLRISATRKTVAEESYAAINQHLSVIDDLQSKINTTKNPKEISELQAQIAIEQANLQASQTRLELVRQQLDAEESLLEARAEKVYSGWFGGKRLTNE